MKRLKTPPDYSYAPPDSEGGAAAAVEPEPRLPPRGRYEEAALWLETTHSIGKRGAAKVAAVLGEERFCVKELRGIDIEEIREVA